MENNNYNQKIENIKVLYVEDEPTIRSAVSEMLSRRISNLFQAANGREGLELFQKEQPEIVITDIKMPEMNGLEMSRLIKEQNPNVVIIITSAHSDSEYFIDAINIGINEYVLKPISRDRLIEAIYKSADNILMQKKLHKQWQTISKLYGAIEQSQSLVVIADKNKKIEYVNSRFSEITGYTSAEIMKEDSGLSFENIFNVSNNEGLKKVFQSNQQWRGEYSIQHKKGDLIWLFGSLTPVLDESSQVTSFVKVGEDISEMKQMATALADSEDKLRNLIEKLGEGIAILDLTYDFVFCNLAMSEIFETKNLLTRNLSEFVISTDEMKKLMYASRGLGIGEKVQVEIPVKTARKKNRYLSVTLTPQLDTKSQGPTGLFCIFKDITRMKELIEEIKAARDAAERAYLTIEEKNSELNESNQKLMLSETKLSELNEILMEYIKATGK
jgi:PAS domain S-box-containing protein